MIFVSDTDAASTTETISCLPGYKPKEGIAVHTRSIMLRKFVLRNTNLPIHDQVNQHHTRSIMLHNSQCCAT
jgi:hypothetical protein